jgi:hypothetical protein
MATEYQVKMKIRLRPIGSPWVKVGIDDYYQTKQLVTLTDFDYDIDAVDCVTLTVEHFNKSDLDSDTAVEIVGIEFFGITDPKFVWAGTYRPDYPKLWASQQEATPARELAGQTYLGWNGVYSLKFDVPVFTWIHQTLNLGWIYQ